MGECSFIAVVQGVPVRRDGQEQGRKPFAQASNGDNDEIFMQNIPQHAKEGILQSCREGYQPILAQRNYTLRSTSQPEPIKNRILESKSSVGSRLTREHFTESLAAGPGYLQEG